jgi:putative ABC transport system permease protein
MFIYNLRLAWLSVRRNPILSVLMVGAIAIGIGVSTTTLTVYHLMSGNPIPDKSNQLYAVQLDSRSKEATSTDPPTQLNYRDAMALMHAHRATRQTADYITSLVVHPPRVEQKPFYAVARVALSDFFPMFEVPFQYGSPWEKSDDESGAQVAVLSHDLNQKLFGGANSVGKSLQLGDRTFRIVGVLAPWSPTPKFYDLENNHFGDTEDLFIPFGLTVPMQLQSSGNTNCYGSAGDGTFTGFLNSECNWIQFWVELPTQADRDSYMQFLNSYVQEQKRVGRFPRPLDNRLQNVTEWLNFNHVVSDDSRALVALALLFLGVCMLNTIGLILAKFLRRSPEIGLRRALGARRSVLFRQYLVEVGIIGVAGGLGGLLLAWLGLWGVRNLISDGARIAHLDWLMVGAALLLALAASIAAGIYPAWRVIRMAPAAYLKVQ